MSTCCTSANAPTPRSAKSPQHKKTHFKFLATNSLHLCGIEYELLPVSDHKDPKQGAEWVTSFADDPLAGTHSTI